MAGSTSRGDFSFRKVAILGHSYVSRLRFDSPMNMPWGEISKYGFPGAKVSNVMQRPDWQDFIAYQPDFTLLLIGGNDINDSSRPSELGREITAFALKVEELTRGACHIMSIEPRLNPRDITPCRYKTVKNAVNRCLGRLPDSKYRFHGMGIENEDLGSDGVHLNAVGNDKLLHRIIEIIQECLGES